LDNLLRSFNAVQAAILVGLSANQALQPGFWRDIDLVVVVAEYAIDQFFPTTD
jgi:hypothetical protein